MNENQINFITYFFLISCGSETSTENFNQVNNEEDEYLEEEYEEDEMKKSTKRIQMKKSTKRIQMKKSTKRIQMKKSTKRIQMKKSTKRMMENHYMMNTGNGIKVQRILTPLHQQVLDGIWVKEQIVKSTSMKVCRP